MRAKLSVRVSKFFLTLHRNMRRRRKTRSIPSPFPVVLLFGLVVLIRYLNVSSLSDSVRSAVQQAAPSSGSAEQPLVREGSAGNVGVSQQKRNAFMERRHAERRAMHRRIEQQKHGEGQETEQRALQDEGAHEKSAQENSTHAVPDGVRTASDTSSASHPEGKDSQAGIDSTKKQEERSETATENTAPKSDTAPEQASRHAERQPGNAGMTEVRMNKSESMGTSKGGGVPVGARVRGKQPEFGGSLGGSKDGMVRGQNVTRVSYTLFKIMKLFGFVSLVDSLAGGHVEWMPEVVERMSFDHPSFQYTAVDDAQGVAKARSVLGDVVDGEYLVSDVEERTANGSDVVFHWTETDGGERDARAKGYMEHIRKVMIAAKKGDNGYIVFGQFPRLDGPQPTYRNGKWVFVGEKEEPFLYNEHVRGVVPMGNGRESYMMYMTFYSLRSIPMGALKA